MASCTLTSLPAAYYYAERQIEKRTEGEERGREKKQSQKPNKNQPTPHALPTEACKEGGPSRGTPWWPPLPPALSTGICRRRSSAGALATGATRVLLHGIALYCAEH